MFKKNKNPDVPQYGKEVPPYNLCSEVMQWNKQAILVECLSF